MKPSQDSLQKRRQREHGRFYTPAWLVDEVLAGCLTDVDIPHSDIPHSLPTILDPACGDGAFLAAALDRLLALPSAGLVDNWEARWRIARTCLHGVDNDRKAIEFLVSRLVARVAPPKSQELLVRDSLSPNFLWGDALQDGAPVKDFPAEAVSLTEGIAVAASPIDWRNSFPRVVSAGGFDLIVGNPPYRRERYARELFERLSETELGRRWRQPRMDLWHYFLHRGLDLLRPGGRLAFVVNGYWTSARSAGPLFARLKAETTLEEIRRFDDQHLFPGVTGRHMAFRLRKGRFDTECVLKDDEGLLRVGQDRLFSSGRLIASPGRCRLETCGNVVPLGERFDVRQGIAENPPEIGARLAARHPDRFRPGEGVFALSQDERDAFGGSEKEIGLFRPAYRARSFERYEAPQVVDRWLLYLTKHTAPSLDELPNIARHLTRFRDILEARREVRRGVIDWWHLHWPREESLFLRPRILSVQMGYEPRFVFARHPTFVGFAMNVIVDRRERAEDPAEAIRSLRAVSGILNSQVAAEWFRRYAKRRGASLDIGGTLLKEFPLPSLDAGREARLDAAVERRMQALDARDDSPDNGRITRLEREIERQVADWYGIPATDLGDGFFSD